MNRMHRLAAISAVAATALAGACKESTSPSTADPTAMATGVSGLNSAFSQNAVFQSLAVLSSSFTLAAPVARPPAAPLAARRDAWLWPSPRDPRLAWLLASRGPGPMLALFPTNVRGKVFQWDTAGGGRYRIMDSTLAGPANGVRFNLYQVNTTTDRPSLPLTTIGYVDLVDQSTLQANVLHVLLKVGTQTAADYTITQVASTTADTLTATGYVTDVVVAGSPVNFTLTHALTLSDSSLVTTYTASGSAASVTMHTAYSGAGGSSVTLDWIVQKGGSVEVVGSSTPSALNFQFKLNGAAWATVGGTSSAPTFSGAGGRALTAADLVAIAQILQGFYNIAMNLGSTFGPAYLVF